MLNISNLLSFILNGHKINRNEAEFLVSENTDLWDILHGANQLRRHFKGDTIGLCSIINAKSGACAEDCKFCAQSSHHSTNVKTYPLVDKTELVKGYERTRQIGANGFSIVTSGNELSDDDFDSLCQMSRELITTYPAVSGTSPSSSAEDHSTPYLCASLGQLTVSQARKLKEAGMRKCHHNLETSERFFPQICTTHSYQERLDTIKNLKEAGLFVCSGGIFGMGETWSDRIDLAFTMRDLNVDSIPLNFLMPVKGTVLADYSSLPPLEILRTIALFRYVLPDKNIRICAGREKNLRDLQSWIFYAGADGMMIGGYLTQPGRSAEDDIRMLKDLGLKFNHTPLF
ncbi:MAG: biotin synthase BioB [Planctomycetota bacterium]